MKLIHKAELGIRGQGKQVLQIPLFAHFISCNFQGEKLVVWYMFDEVNSYNIQARTLHLVRTGEPFEHNYKYQFIGTAQDFDEEFTFVLHLFEITA